MGPGSAIRKNPNIAYRALRDGSGGVLLHLESGQYHGLNEVGASIWELIDGARTPEEIAGELAPRFEDPPDGLRDIVVGFCAGLRDRDLISDG